MSKEKDMGDLIRFNRDIVSLIIIRFILFVIIVAAGYFFAKYGITWYDTALIFLLLIIYVIIPSIVKSITKVNAICISNRATILEATIASRLFQWTQILEMLNNIDGRDYKRLIEIKQADLLSTKAGTSCIIKLLAESIFNDNLFNPKKKLTIKVVYFQVEPDLGAYLEIRHRENYVCLGFEECSIEGIFLTKFYRNDGSAAGLAWEKNQAVFIANTDFELAKDKKDRRFIHLESDKQTKSLVCLPISTSTHFWGVLCVSFNETNRIRESDSFKYNFENSINPIIKQLSIIETIREVRTQYWKRFPSILYPNDKP